MKTPEKQENYQVAFARALEGARARSSDDLAALGVVADGDGVPCLPVLDAVLAVDLREGNVRLADGSCEVGIAWQILVLHYLEGAVPWPPVARWMGFADFIDARGYESVHRGRVLARLCATAGRDRDTFLSASRRLKGQAIDWGDEGFEFAVFPRVSLRVAWYDGDDEFPPNASLAFPDNILSFFPVEDVVVVSERLVSRLQGKGW
ncbi:MAG: DUF3786 domain-containing protein [Nitrospiraceae bacterium]|nr:DUF3786 domain-containing protein [Nitrospiraceae bacterium]